MDWIPAIATSTLLGVALWLSRNVISARLTNAVRHEYDEKIENLKTSLRQNEEAFKAELKAKESQIEALRSGALTGIVNRQTALYQRQLLAVEQLWGSIISLAPAKSISSWMAVIKFEAAVEEASKNQRFRDIFKNMEGGVDLNNLGIIDASKLRPFVSPLAWAYYSAYLSIVTHSVLRLKTLQIGIDRDYADLEKITQLVKVALPFHTDYIEKHGPYAFHHLLDVLEVYLLAELDNILNGQKADKDHIEKAALILQESEQLMAENDAFKSGSQP